jgi:hypothetical protein
VVVGSHDPSATVPVGGWVGAVDHLVSMPYHTQSTSPSDICQDVGTSTLKKVSKINPGAGITGWTCGGGGGGFTGPINVGESYLLQPIAGGPSTWKPETF